MYVNVIPGTVLPYSGKGTAFSAFGAMLGATGGLSLGQVCSISGLEYSTVQNWVKRGFVAHPVNKLYGERQLARILLISALRNGMKIESVGELLSLVNGDTEDESDDIISEYRLYDYFCEAVGELGSKISSAENARQVIERITCDYSGPYADSRDKLITALTVMVLAYACGVLKNLTDMYFENLKKSNK